MKFTEELTIVITTFNSEDVIESCLDSINGKCEIIIIENSNSKNLKNNLEKKYNNLTCHLLDENLGYGKANNFGLKKVKTKYALILNPDVKLEENTIENFLSAANKHPDFALMGPLNSSEIKSNDFLRSSLLKVKYIKGFAMFFNMKEFEEIGFFDENFFIYLEEIDLCRRVSKINKAIYLVPGIKVKHEGGQSHKKSIADQMELSRNWHWMWSRFYFQKKYYGYFLAFFSILPKLLSSATKFVYFFIIFDKKKREIYFHRMSGLVNSICGKKSWFRPKI
jgi:GT2 family glycosyltransferase